MNTRIISVLALALLTLASFAALRFSNSAQSNTTASPIKPGAADAPLADAWAGKPVMSAEHVQRMVNARLFNAPKLGEPAPDFTLVNALTGEPVSLRQLCHTKPVVLYFSSYSCQLSHDSAEDLSNLALRFQNIVQFVVVYIREAHPEGGFQPLPEGQPFVLPAQFEFADRVKAAQRYAADEKFHFPVLVDAMNDAVSARWGAWPLRLFVVDQAGRVVFAGQQGPWFFKPTKTFDPRLPGVPEGMRNLPGYSKESLEEFLGKLT